MNKLSVMLISVLLISCNNAPKIPIVEDCAILQKNNGEYYLHCLMANDSTKEWHLTIPEGKGYTCVSPDSRGKLEKYAKDLENWTRLNCNNK